MRKILSVLISLLLFSTVLFSCKDKKSETVKNYIGDSFIISDFSGEIKNVDDAIKLTTDYLKLGKKQSLQEQSTNEIDNLDFYRLEQMYDGIPVYKRNIVATAIEGEANFLSGNFISISNISTEPKIDEGTAKLKATEYLNGMDYTDVEISNIGLTIYTFDIEPTLCWKLEINILDFTLFVDANNGEIVEIISDIDFISTDTAQGQTGITYTLPIITGSPAHLGNEEKNVYVYSTNFIHKFGENFRVVNYGTLNNVTSSSKSAVDALGNMMKIYDFYDNVLFRKGFDDNYSELNIVVDILSTEGKNAFCSGNNICFVVGKSNEVQYSANLDIVAHEFTHAVNEYTWGGGEGSAKISESSAIDEAFADIFGEIIEKYSTGNHDWRIAEDIRNLKDGKWRKYEQNLNTNENYFNSQILSYCAYFLTSGFENSSEELRNQLQNFNLNDENDLINFSKLWYITMLMLPSNPTFQDVANVCSNSSLILYDAELITYEQSKAVTVAFAIQGYMPDLKNIVSDNINIDFEDFTKVFDLVIPTINDDSTQNETTSSESEITNENVADVFGELLRKYFDITGFHEYLATSDELIIVDGCYFSKIIEPNVNSIETFRSFLAESYSLELVDKILSRYEPYEMEVYNPSEDNYDVKLHKDLVEKDGALYIHTWDAGWFDHVLDETIELIDVKDNIYEISFLSPCTPAMEIGSYYVCEFQKLNDKYKLIDIEEVCGEFQRLKEIELNGILYARPSENSKPLFSINNETLNLLYSYEFDNEVWYLVQGYQVKNCEIYFDYNKYYGEWYKEEGHCYGWIKEDKDSEKEKSYTTKVSPVENFEYEIKDDKVTITEYIGDDESVIIPDKIEGLAVTTIGKEAFYECDSLTSIEIPDSVTEIGGGAFASCDSLTSIKIPDSVTKIGEYAFFRCYNLTSATIPDSVTIIGKVAFSECESLTSVKIPPGITVIENGVFSRCYNLTSIEIPNSVTEIGVLAFSRCYDLTSVTIPYSVTKIEEDAFLSCDNLTEIKGVLGSYAEDYAKGNYYSFVPIS
ncbi:MAG: leucine-rich repeat protein [Oscillospiraceae bacterium]|nr:leucine-rich repeat protein [Oscillospiraceae bacterium]